MMTTVTIRDPGRNKEENIPMDEDDDVHTDSIGQHEVSPMALEDFHQHLIDIDDELCSDELEALKFLCRDYIAGWSTFGFKRKGFFCFPYF